MFSDGLFVVWDFDYQNFLGQTYAAPVLKSVHLLAPATVTRVNFLVALSRVYQLGRS